MWQQWFLRYIYNNGWYTGVLHNEYSVIKDTNIDRYHDLGIDTSTIKDTQQSSKSISKLPDLRTTPLFDFHMNHITHSTTLQFRQYLAPAEHIDQCWLIENLNKPNNKTK